jgi:hypothetical protein
MYSSHQRNAERCRLIDEEEFAPAFGLVNFATVHVSAQEPRITILRWSSYLVSLIP